jgi:hypothetical protein
MTTPIDIIESIVKMIERLDYLELSVLENAIQGRRLDMRRNESPKFSSLEKIKEV